MGEVKVTRKRKLKGSVVDCLGRFNWWPQFRHDYPDLARRHIEVNRKVREAFAFLEKLKGGEKLDE